MIGWGIWHWLERRADLAPQKAAVIDGEAATSYRDLRDRVATVAGGMRAQGVGRGDRVAILSINRAQYIEVLFAAARLGAIAVPLNWRLTAPELAFQVGDSEPVMLFVDPELQSLAEGVRAQPESRSLRTYVAFDVEAAAPPWAGSYSMLHEAAAVPPDGRFDDPFLIMYTSGTTGRPKGAVLTQATQLWNAVNISAAINLTAADVTLNALPMFHTGGIGLLVLPSIHAGATAVIHRKFDPEETVRLIRRHRVTAMFGVPSIYLMLLASEAFARADLSRMRFSCGGAPCPLTIIEAFRDRGLMFQQGFGLTETAPTCLLIPADDAFRKAGSAGKATMHAEVRVVDDDGRDVPADGIGEVWTRGPNLFSGYWRRPDATAEVFEDGWFKTGDLARIDAEGFIHIVDRKKDMIISGGMNIYPAEIEAALEHHPRIADAAVFGIPSEEWGEAVHAVVVAQPGSPFSEAEVIAFAREHLAGYKLPRSVSFAEEIPRTGSGKILKRVLREPFWRGRDRRV